MVGDENEKFPTSGRVLLLYNIAYLYCLKNKIPTISGPLTNTLILGKGLNK